jgi:hypothetical protein
MLPYTRLFSRSVPQTNILGLFQNKNILPRLCCFLIRESVLIPKESCEYNCCNTPNGRLEPGRWRSLTYIWVPLQ